MSDNVQLGLTLVPIEIWNTCYMVFAAALIACVIGIPLGILLTVTGRGHLRENRALNTLLGIVVNIGRSFPFAILMIAVIPLTRFIAGSSLGTTASIVPLSLAAIPFAARLTETAFLEVDKALVEAAIVMGATPTQVIQKVLFPESLPSLIAGLTTLIINLIGYSAMAGTMGGGGLGKIAIQYGYQRFNPFMIGVTVFFIVIIVQGVQWLGDYWVRNINRKRGVQYTHE